MYKTAARFLSRHGLIDYEPKRIRFFSAPRIENESLETVMYMAIKKAIDKKGLRVL